METTECAGPAIAPEKPRQRRVGTFTLGVTLVAAGGVMLAAMLFPRPELLQWALKLSPVILILLGIETLFAARGGGKIKYDWVGMLLCFILIGAALCMCAAAWYVSWYWPEQGSCYDGSVAESGSGFSMEFDAFSARQLRLLELAAGDTVRVEAELTEGSVHMEVLKDDSREVVFRDSPLTERSFSFGVEESGTYEVWLTGERAAGSIRVTARPI